MRGQGGLARRGPPGVYSFGVVEREKYCCFVSLLHRAYLLISRLVSTLEFRLEIGFLRSILFLELVKLVTQYLVVTLDQFMLPEFEVCLKLLANIIGGSRCDNLLS